MSDDRDALVHGESHGSFKLKRRLVSTSNNTI